MTLTLTLIKSPTGLSAELQQKVFVEDGGLIGRGASNDWVLEDPERFLSSKHCQVVYQGGQYQLVDLSTNGTFVNGANEPLGRGNQVPLNTGDQIDVGDYRFKVTIEDGGFGASPFDGDSLTSTPTDIDLNAGDSVAPEGMFMSSDYGGAVGDIAPDELKVVDPLLALDKATDPFAAPQPKSEPLDASPFGSQEDSADLMSEAAIWPDAKPEPSLLPDDWDQDISILAKRSPQTPPASHGLSDNDSLIAKGSITEIEAEFVSPKLETARPETPRPETPKPRPTPAGRPPAAARHPAPSPGRTPPLSEPKAALKRTPPAPPAPEQPKASDPQRTLDTGSALLDALGLHLEGLDDSQMEALHTTIGLMMRETLEGLMQILRSRTSIKNEFRMNVTSIQAVENNPLKFSVNLDELLETMFVRQSKAYQSPVEAVQESFDAIADHQVAVIAGIRQAFRSAMGQFDPSILEEQFKQSGKGSFVPGLSGAKYWAAYEEHYNRMMNNMERSFQELFGDEFVQAYEDQLNKLASIRRRSKKLSQ